MRKRPTHTEIDAVRFEIKTLIRTVPYHMVVFNSTMVLTIMYATIFFAHFHFVDDVVTNISVAVAVR